MTEPSMAELIAGWAPEPVETTDTITAGPALALAGLLDTDPAVTGPGDPVPPLWHWLYFLDRPATRELGPDGHPAAGRFMPPVPQRRRMFAGGRVSYHSPIRCGDEITRRSELAGATIRPGRTGELLFVTVRSVFTRAGAAIATEEQDLVYRSGPPATAAAAPKPSIAPAAPWQLRTVPDPVLLFRFSALTYNAHRIHYDTGYATAVEGHPGLELPRRHRPHQAVTKLSFRARAPLYAGQPCAVTGGPGHGGCTMRAVAPDGTEVLTADGDLTS